MFFWKAWALTFGVDLFGMSILEAGKKRGRPLHVPTPENRQKIVGLFAEGHPPEKVAGALSISLPTLRRHYRDLVDNFFQCQLILKAEMMAVLIDQAKAGNAVAADKVLKRLDRSIAQAMPRTAKTPKLGKKEARLKEAYERPGAGWGDVMGVNLKHH
jgi:hypothetical protein